MYRVHVIYHGRKLSMFHGNMVLSRWTGDGPRPPPPAGPRPPPPQAALRGGLHEQFTVDTFKWGALLKTVDISRTMVLTGLLIGPRQLNCLGVATTMDE